MKKLIVAFVFFIAAALAFAQNPSAVIREMTGTVELKKSGSVNWTQAKAGDIIEKATIVSTGFKSSALLTVGNSTLMVRPLTRLSLEELMNQNETETINISLSTGRVKVDVKPPAGSKASFTVQSPAATASVRGTSFEMDTESIQVLEGAVSYVPTLAAAGATIRPVTVSAGEESWVDSDTGLAVAPASAAESSRTLPSLAGQNAGTIPENGTRTDNSGSLGIGVDIGGSLFINVELIGKN